MNTTSNMITVEALVKAPLQKVWSYYNEAAHIVHWNFAADSWHCPKSDLDLRVGGRFSSTMSAKDGSFSFDFWGTYDEVNEHSHVAYTMGDGRKATVDFLADGFATKVTVCFEMETENSEELQRGGWQAILDNFKKYTEAN
jgi:uncharacterized protein YndB with AHSA1/START domain